VPGDIRAYRELRVGPGDRVLDLGGNIGASVKLWMDAGAAEVIAVEPDPDNFAMLQMNVERWGTRVTAIQAAVVAHHEPKQNLYVNGRKGKDWHSIIPVKGRQVVEVAAVNFQSLLDRFQPTHLKVDVEGAEYELFEDIALPDSVRAIVMEVHLMRPDQKEQHGPALFRALEERHGFRYERGPNITPSAWANTVVAFR
jgi:FkbM family methyltransferase